MNQYKYSADYDDHLLAELYDLSETYTNDVDLLRKLITGLGSLKILECFSGTGRILMPLAQDGHVITGIELAPLPHKRCYLQRHDEGTQNESKEQARTGQTIASTLPTIQPSREDQNTG